jgi:KaiC/GvpD/RAD55 family RecA-like ATPase
MRETPTQFLSRNGIKYDESGAGREIVMDCPSCGKKGHCFVNSATWLWNCKRCDARGNEASLKVSLGLQYDVSAVSDKGSVTRVADDAFARQLLDARGKSSVETWANNLMHHPSAARARKYLQDRGLSADLCHKFCVGWCANPDGTTQTQSRRVVAGAAPEDLGPGWITLPSFAQHQNGKPVVSSVSVVKLRSVPPSDRAFRRLEGGKSILFAPCGIDPTSTLLIVGGEIDALSCVAAGWNNVASSTVGEPNWNEESTEAVEACEDIVIVYDNDDAGRKGAASLAERLGSHRCRIGTWPNSVKDANEALVALGAAFSPGIIVESAKHSGGDAVVKVDDLRSEYLSELRGSSPRGVSSGWPDLDSLVGGIRFGEVTLVTGDTASGKSTFASQFALNMAKYGHRTLFCPFELGARRQLAKWVRQEGGCPPDTMDDQAVNAVIDRLQRLPLFMLRRYGSIRLEAMRNTMTHCIRRLGVKFIVLDHLHFMIQEGPEERMELDSMMKMIAETAVDHKVHIVVVAHPRQHHSSNDTHRDNRIIQASDLKGSAGLKQLSDNIWSVWRPRKADRSDLAEGSESGRSVVYVLKNRDDYGNEGSVAFKFGLRSARFEPPDEERQASVSTAPPEAKQASREPAERRLRRVRAAEPVSSSTVPNPRHWTEVAKED